MPELNLTDGRCRKTLKGSWPAPVCDKRLFRADIGLGCRVDDSRYNIANGLALAIPVATLMGVPLAW